MVLIQIDSEELNATVARAVAAAMATVNQVPPVVLPKNPRKKPLRAVAAAKATVNQVSPAKNPRKKPLRAPVSFNFNVVLHRMADADKTVHWVRSVDGSDAFYIPSLNTAENEYYALIKKIAVNKKSRAFARSVQNRTIKVLAPFEGETVKAYFNPMFTPTATEKQLRGIPSRRKPCAGDDCIIEEL